MRKNSAFDTWTSQGSSWTLRSLGNLDIMDLLESPWILDIYNLLEILTSWQFRQHRSLSNSNLFEDLGLQAIFFGSSLGEFLDL